MSKSLQFQALHWDVEEYSESDDEPEHIEFYIYGLNKNNETVCTIISDFKPYVYVELPIEIEWTPIKIKHLSNYINSKFRFPPSKIIPIWKKSLYFADLDEDNETKKRPFLFIVLNNTNEVYHLARKVFSYPIMLRGVGKIKCKVHEHTADSLMKFCTVQQLSYTGWLNVQGKYIQSEEDKKTNCQHEIRCGWKKVTNYDCDIMTQPIIMSWDIETYSHIHTKFPNAHNPEDCVFQIGITLERFNHPETRKKILLTLKKCRPIKGVEVREHETERQLIEDFTYIVQREDPFILVGYNILGFDYKYMADRCLKYADWFTFSKLGRLKNNRATLEDIKWSSSAYGNVEMKYLKMHGRMSIDLLPLIKQNYKLDRYKLDFVSEYFLKDHKDPVSPKDIFELYKRGTPKDIQVVGKYCVQDTVLPLKLMTKLSTWVELVEMSKVVQVPIMDIFCRGQQRKVFSQTYSKAYRENYVIPYNPYENPVNIRFTGAFVFKPTPGFYKHIYVLDFKSLYPSIIIAYNISWDTYVPDTHVFKSDDQCANIFDIQRVDNIRDEVCHVIVCEDHNGCVHDTSGKKVEKKKIVCQRITHRFMKEPKGILPQMLEELLGARKNTRKVLAGLEIIDEADGLIKNGGWKNLKQKMESKDISFLESSLKKQQWISEDETIKQFCKVGGLTEKQRQVLDLQMLVLDKRQLSYKISANSMYGSLGTKFGDVKLLPGGMSTTAMGRMLITETARIVKEKYQGDTVYGDTDSVMVKFPYEIPLEKSAEFGDKLAEDITSYFPPAIILEFEKTFREFLVLTKKRYAGTLCNKYGEVVSVMKKGLVLARRDNCLFLREIYSDVLDAILASKELNEIQDIIIHHTLRLMSGRVPVSQLIITKSLKDEYKNPESTPHFMLAQKMKRRGHPIEAGSRIEYIFMRTPNPNDLQGYKSEDPAYYKDYSEYIDIDYFYYYQRQLVNPIQQLLEVAFGNKTFMNQIEKVICNKQLIVKQLNSMFQFVQLY